MARILVIDDDADLREVMQETLQSSGHEVVLAPDGIQGLQLQRDRPADVVITDIFMPGRDGIETIQHLGREFPGVKIIAISGGDRTRTMDLRRDAELLGASRTLRKPFELTELLKAVSELLGEPRPGV